jgi:TonB-linked SusC/RagA family outer membrane protein
LRGRVVNEQGEPLPGLSVLIQNSMIKVITDVNGEFRIPNAPDHSILLFSGAEVLPLAVDASQQFLISITMKTKINELDQVIMMAYGQTTRRLNTGNIAKVSATEIGIQPVSNPIAALEGRVPGVLITQSTGVPGSSFKVEIRGRSALDLSLSKNDPLYVIDGVPFEMGNTPTNLLVSAANNPTSTSEGGLSALNTIDPQDIESIEILKDADATAIYGSRGANGVILITTKSGKSGKTKFTVSVTRGSSRVTRLLKMLNTQQYVAMRKEAFANDGIVPTTANAPDILLWDTTRYTDIQKLLIGGSAQYTDAQLSLSGGSAATTFLIGGAYHKETTVFPGDFSDVRVSTHVSLKHQSTDKKFSMAFKALYANDNNHLISADVSQYFRLSPNIKLFDSTGHLAWDDQGVAYSSFNSFLNPLALFNQRYHSINANLSSNLHLQYQLLSRLSIQVSLGYNDFRSNEHSIRPKSAIAPTSSTLASSQFGHSTSTSWIVEPQLDYHVQIHQLKITALLGSTFQDRSYSGTNISGTNYTSDLLLNTLSAAGVVTATNFDTKYRYAAVFSRLNFNWSDKYLLNLSARRDGSSRFGPGRQFANFGAAGAAWVFSTEPFFVHHFHYLSFGKLRASYGQTGNDQIGDYKFYDLWSNIPPTYQGVSGLIPTALFNPDYSWEVNRKFEAALDLGFLKDRLLLSIAYYRNRSSNQLTNYNLPIQAGFATVIRNLPALVQNSGLEISLTTKNIQSKAFTWTTTANLTIPHNKLVSFPGLATSNYFGTVVEGQSLTVIRRFKYLGVDPATGVYNFEDVDKDGMLTGAKDFQLLGNRDPQFYGGLQNTISYKGFQLDFFFQFAEQNGSNYLASVGNFSPGRGFNQPALVLGRWQHPGDLSNIQRFTTSSSTAAGVAASTRLNVSNGIYSDASYIRLKNISLSYQPHFRWMKKAHLDNLKIFINGQNLLTLTHFKGADPESQSYFQMPPLKTLAAGIQITL